MVNFLLHQSQYFTIFGMKIYLYGVMITLGIVAGIALAFWTFKKKGIDTSHIVNIGLIAIPSAILGARIYYCTFIDNSYDFLSFFDITRGGLAVYGAIIGGALAVLVYSLVKKINFLKIADALVPSLAIGQCLGRIGCYFGGCCYGQETDFHVFPFAVEVDGVWRLATFFYESFATLIICITLIVLLRYLKQDGFIFCGYFFLYGIARFFIEGVRGDSLYVFGLRVSQVLSFILILASIGLAVYLYIKYTKNGTMKPIFKFKKCTAGSSGNDVILENEVSQSESKKENQADIEKEKISAKNIENEQKNLRNNKDENLSES